MIFVDGELVRGQEAVWFAAGRPLLRQGMLDGRVDRAPLTLTLSPLRWERGFRNAGKNNCFTV